jgi:hypothetical protein
MGEFRHCHKNTNMINNIVVWHRREYPNATSKKEKKQKKEKKNLSI